ncbi:MAG TPA: hypothetical protein VE175_05910, partial [Woeseiaceae bacterium]|nr:hypothetical protein [Woeseiaceae bacterium]
MIARTALFLAFLLPALPARAAPETAGDAAERDRFVSDLMARMTLREKFGQLNLLTSSLDVTGPTLREGNRE